MLKLSDTLKSKLKDTVDMPINHDRTKDKSPTPSLKNSPKVQKKHPISPLDDRSFNNKESNHENDTLPSKQINTKIIFKIRTTYLYVGTEDDILVHGWDLLWKNVLALFFKRPWEVFLTFHTST